MTVYDANSDAAAASFRSLLQPGFYLPLFLVFCFVPLWVLFCRPKTFTQRRNEQKNINQRLAKAVLEDLLFRRYERAHALAKFL